MLRQMEFALFDMRIHREPARPSAPAAGGRRGARRGGAGAGPAFNRFAHSFSHIFDGGYAAGYYSYKWAEVLSADAWSAFEESRRVRPRDRPPLPPEILEVGGSRAAIDSFKAFRGREPRIDALLRHQGMA